MWRVLATAILLAGCGRLSFEPQVSGSTTDAADLDAALLDAAGDGMVDGMADATTVVCSGATYLAFPTDTYDNAIASCASMGRWLVSIDDAVENSLLLSLAPLGTWIGINDRAVEGVFEWVGPASTYMNWRNGQPNDGGGGTTEDCGEMRTDGLWYDMDCTSEVNAYVCECP